MLQLVKSGTTLLHAIGLICAVLTGVKGPLVTHRAAGHVMFEFSFSNDVCQGS
jgi:hypothetical protein